MKVGDRVRMASTTNYPGQDGGFDGVITALLPAINLEDSLDVAVTWDNGYYNQYNSEIDVELIPNLEILSNVLKL